MDEQSSGTVELEHLQADQEVYSSDGEKVGNVAGITEDRDTGEPYLEVSAPIFKYYYVPRSVIEFAVLGKPVRLKVPHDVVVERYRERPNVL